MMKNGHIGLNKKWVEAQEVKEVGPPSRSPPTLGKPTS